MKLIKSASRLLTRSMHSSSALSPETVVASFAEFEDYKEVVQDEVANIQAGKGTRISSFLRDMISYNVQNCRYFRGKAVVMNAVELTNGLMTDEQKKDIYTLGWMAEYIFTIALIIDDLCDHATNRREQPCWHMRHGSYDLSASRDAKILFHSIYIYMQEKYGNAPWFRRVYNPMRHTMFIALTSHSLEPWIRRTREFTVPDWEQSNRFGFGHGFFAFPGIVAMEYFGHPSQEEINAVTRVGLQLGIAAAADNDWGHEYLGTGSSEKLGDIQMGDQGALYHLAKKHASPKQWAIIQENYGKPEVRCKERVLQIYDQLDMKTLGAEFADKYCQEILNEMERWDAENIYPGIPRSYFRYAAERISNIQCK